MEADEALNPARKGAQGMPLAVGQAVTVNRGKYSKGEYAGREAIITSVTAQSYKVASDGEEIAGYIKCDQCDPVAEAWPGTPPPQPKRLPKTLPKAECKLVEVRRKTWNELAIAAGLPKVSVTVVASRWLSCAVS